LGGGEDPRLNRRIGVIGPLAVRDVKQFSLGFVNYSQTPHFGDSQSEDDPEGREGFALVDLRLAALAIGEDDRPPRKIARDCGTLTGNIKLIRGSSRHDAVHCNGMDQTCPFRARRQEKLAASGEGGSAGTAEGSAAGGGCKWR
jgi:hypothetical protein